MLAGISMVVVSILNGRGGFPAALAQLSQIPSETAPNLNGALVSLKSSPNAIANSPERPL